MGWGARNAVNREGSRGGAGGRTRGSLDPASRGREAPKSGVAERGTRRSGERSLTRLLRAPFGRLLGLQRLQPAGECGQLSVRAAKQLHVLPAVDGFLFLHERGDPLRVPFAAHVREVGGFSRDRLHLRGLLGRSLPRRGRRRRLLSDALALDGVTGAALVLDEDRLPVRDLLRIRTGRAGRHGGTQDRRSQSNDESSHHPPPARVIIRSAAPSVWLGYYRRPLPVAKHDTLPSPRLPV